jgi:hypothetical protein
LRLTTPHIGGESGIDSFAAPFIGDSPCSAEDLSSRQIRPLAR